MMQIVNISNQVFCSIWISNHERVLRERYELYLQNAKLVTYMNKDLKTIVTEPDMSFEEFAVFMFDNVPFAIEHNEN